MANRAERRRRMRDAHRKHQSMMESYTKEQLIGRLMQNGITQEDLAKEYDIGYKEGYKSAAIPIIQACYAAVCLAINEEFGFGEDECFRVLKCMDQKVIFAIENRELCEEVIKKTGLKIEFDEPFDRIVKQE